MMTDFVGRDRFLRFHGIGRISEPRSIDRFYYSGDLLDVAVSLMGTRTPRLSVTVNRIALESHFLPVK